MRAKEHIKHRVAKLHTHARAPIRGHPRYQWWLLGAAIGIILISINAYFVELQAVQKQDPTTPMPCNELLFSTSRRLCEQTLLSFYSGKHGEELAPLCSKNRDAFGSAAKLCVDYDKHLTSVYYGQGLENQGIAPWEPEKPLSYSGKLEVRTLSAIQSLNLLCNGKLIKTSWTGNSTNYSMQYEIEKGKNDCILTARTADGSVTSEHFLIIR